MEKFDKLIIKIVEIGVNGEGIAKDKEYIIFVPFVLKNEIVEVEITKIKDNICFAKLIKIIEKSPDRIDAICPYYGSCGGCALMHTNYNDQLKIKTNSVNTTLAKFLKSKIPILPTEPSDEIFAYRNKLEFCVRDGKIGFNKLNSHNLIEIDDCNLAGKFCKDFIKVAKNLVPQTNNLTYIIIRNINEKLSVLLVFSKPTKFNENAWIKNLKHFFNNFSLYMLVSKNIEEVYNKKYTTIYGEKTLKIYENNLCFNISPHSFLQTNINIQNKIYNEIFKHINKNSTIINAYSGAGFLSAILAQKAKQVFGVEINADASCDAEKLKQENNIKNLTNICGDCKEKLPKIIKQIKDTNNLVLIVNPPRKGIDKSVALNILKSMPTKIVYISCNPATLGRDLKILCEKYSIKLVKPFDMFPQTKHIETLVVLEKCN